MRIIKVKNYEKISHSAANVIAAQILLKPDLVLGLATGSSPIGIYEELVKKHQLWDLDFSEVRTVNLDEYCGMEAEDLQSYHYFMRKHLFDKVNLKLENVHLPDGKASDIAEECVNYDAMIRKLGGIDLQLLGIGRNGHIGFNEPSDSFPLGTHCVKLTSSTIEANQRFFGSTGEVPRQAITMGIGSIMKARRILLVASGKDKAEAIREMLTGPITPKHPASVLQLHPDAVLIGDEEALSDY